jgi:cell division cycle protein 20 (cofactor of APC complex)
MENATRGVYSNNAGAGVGGKAKKAFRHIPAAPERILDAPELIDDYYLNLIDWGSTNKVGGFTAVECS